MTTAFAERQMQCEQALAAARRRLDVENVHRLRVSIRRLQAALRLMDRKEERRALRPLMKLAGEVRNRDIARVLAGDRPVAVELLRQRREHAPALKQALLAFSLPSVEEGRVALDANVLEDFFRAGRRAARKPTAKRMHELRLAGKRLRYTVEFLAPKLDQSAGLRLKELKRLQDALGDANDCVTARALVHDQEFHAYLAELENEHRKRFAEIWRESFGVLGAWESWQLFLTGA